MPDEQTDNKKIVDRKGLLRRLVWIVGGIFLFLMLVIFTIAQVWLVPNLVRKRFERGLSEFCQGPVEIESVKANYSGQVYLERIKFFDKAKRQWMLAERVQATFANWPSFKPVITEIEIDRLNVQILSADGKFVLPLVRPSRQSSGANIRVDIHKLNIKEAILTVADAQGSKVVYGNLMLSAFRRDRNYEFLLKRLISDKSEVFIADGRVNIQDLDFDVSLWIKHQFTKAEMILPFAALNMPGVSAEGSFAADLTITGCFGKPTEIQPVGAIQLRNWVVEADCAAARSALNTDIEVKSSGLCLNNLSICDLNGVEWFSTNTIEIGLESWHGLKPIVTEIEVESPMLQVIFADGKFSFPIWYPRSKKFPDLQRLALQDLAIVVNKPDGMKIAFDKLWLDAVKQEDSYNISVSQRASDDSNAVSVKGPVNPKSLEVDFFLKVEDKIQKSETGLLLDSINIPKFLAGGGISADLVVKGSVKKPIQLQPTGTIILDDWVIEADNGGAINKFDATIEVGAKGISLGNLAVRDSNGLEWLSAETSKLTFENWPGSRPVLTEIDIWGLKLEASLIDGRFHLPMTLPMVGSEQAKNEHLDLQRFTVRDAVVGITAPKCPRMTFDSLGLQLARQPDCYDIQLTWKTPADSNSLTAKASFNPTTSEIELSLQSEIMVEAAEMMAILSALNAPSFSVQGKLTTDLTIVGCLNKPETLQPKGLIRLKDWVAASEDGVALHSLSTDVRLDGSKLWLENFAVRDANGLEWFSAKSSEITLKNWPGLRPILTKIETEGLTLRTYLVDDKLRLPAGFSFNEYAGLKSGYFSLQKLVVRDMSIGIAEREDSKIACDYLSLQPAEQEGFYDILLTYSKPEGPSRICLKGVVNPTSLESRLSLDIDHSVQKRETSVVFAALGMPQASAEGKLIADLTIAGRLNEPSGLQSTGSVEFDDWVLFIKDRVLVSNLVTVVKIDGQRLNFDKVNAVVCNGPVNGSLYIEAKQNQPIEYGGQFLGQKMSFVELTSLLGGPDRKATRGSVTLNYNFTDKGGDLKSLSGEGHIFLDDADVTVFPIIPYIFRTMGLAELDPLKMSDAQCTFSMAGPIVKIKSAHIANPFGAVEFEPGGTINLQTGHVEMYVMAVPLRQLDILARRIPFADIFFNLKDKLTRFYIKGHWSSPPTKLITKTPIKDVREGTIGFLRDVARNGGQFSQEMLKRFRALLPVRQDKND